MSKEKILDTIAAAIIIFLIASWAYSGLWKPFRVVVSGSMEPTINKGDIVYVVKARGQITPGEIVLYTRPDFPDQILHRVIKVETTNINGHPIECYIIKGDNNPVVDPPYPIAPGKTINCVPRSAIIGKEVYRIPSVGKLFFWMFG